MNLAKAKKSIENLKKIKDIIEVSKFSTLQELNNASKVSKAALDFSLIAKEIFKTASEKYKINSRYYRIDKHVGTLWVYVTMPKTLLSNSNDPLEKRIKNNFNLKKDQIIVLGKEAIEFAQKNNYKIALQFEDIEDNSISIATMISILYETNEISKVNCVYHSDYNSFVTLLPISEATIDEKIETNISTKSKFYPSIHESLDTITHVYIMQIISAILARTKYFAIKEKLLRHEESIKAVEDNIFKKRKQAIKYARNKETEDLILINGNSKRIAKERGKDE